MDRDKPSTNSSQGLSNKPVLQSFRRSNSDRNNSQSFTESENEQDDITNNDEEDVPLKLYPSGSVLIPSDDPYDKDEKIKEANKELARMSDGSNKTKITRKVRFNESVISRNGNETNEIRLSEEDDIFSDRLDIKKDGSDSSGINNILISLHPTDALISPISEKSDDEICTSKTDNYRIDHSIGNNKNVGTTQCSTKIAEEIEKNTNQNDCNIVDKSIKVLSENVQQLYLNEKDNRKYEKKNRNDKKSYRIKKELLGTKSLEINLNPPHLDYTRRYIKQNNSNMSRPASSRIISARRVKNYIQDRPHTAPFKRNCSSVWAKTKLPTYNGLRSEYGLSAEQIQERIRIGKEINRINSEKIEERVLKQELKRQENDWEFSNWLAKKRQQEAEKYNKQKNIVGKMANFKSFSPAAAPTNHLIRMGALRKKFLIKQHHANITQDLAVKKDLTTYRIYLGLSFE